jgi:hypothetical protein
MCSFLQTRNKTLILLPLFATNVFEATLYLE